MIFCSPMGFSKDIRLDKNSNHHPTDAFGSRERTMKTTEKTKRPSAILPK